jgi:MFS family permease
MRSSIHPAVEREEFTQYGQRWVILLAFSLSCLSLGIIQNGFSPIAGIVAVLYNCEPLLVQAQTIIIIAMFVPSNFVVIPYIKKNGLKATMHLGAITMMVGTWMRLLVWPIESFWVVSFGTAVAAFGQVCFLNSTSRIATLWFGDNQRALATSIGSLSTPLGGMFGFIIPSLILSESDILNSDKGKDKFIGFIFLQNGIATVAGILVLVYMRSDKPPTPPSKVATMKPKPLSFTAELKKLGGNSNYLLLAASYALSCGSITAIGAILSSLTSPYSYDAGDNSLFGGAFILFGVTGSLLSGTLLDRFQRYKLLTLLSTCLSCLLLALIFASLPSGDPALFGLNLAVLGLV